jgi:endogenous inhibitor of DNA gyrase (YacG/DUF329 family)
MLESRETAVCVRYLWLNRAVATQSNHLQSRLQPFCKEQRKFIDLTDAVAQAVPSGESTSSLAVGQAVDKPK